MSMIVNTDSSTRNTASLYTGMYLWELENMLRDYNSILFHSKLWG